MYYLSKVIIATLRNHIRRCYYLQLTQNKICPSWAFPRWSEEKSFLIHSSPSFISIKYICCNDRMRRKHLQYFVYKVKFWLNFNPTKRQWYSRGFSCCRIQAKAHKNFCSSTYLPQRGSQSVLQVYQKQNMNFANHWTGYQATLTPPW